MNEEKQSENLKASLHLSDNKDIKIRKVPIDPIIIAKEILEFRKNHKDLDLLNTQFYTYSLANMVDGITQIQEIKNDWESKNKKWADNYEVTLSVYPAMRNKILNFYFIPTWIKKGSFIAGIPMNGNILDFVKHVYDASNYPNSSYGPFYTNDRGYIYDLGSSCP